MNTVEICECGNELVASFGSKMCDNCHHQQKDCICKGGLNDQSDHPSWRNACKCGREKYKNGEEDWICPLCILNANDCPCQVLEVRLVNNETKQVTCIETYPVSDGSDRCRLGVIHEGLHRDEFGRFWLTETVTTISQEQPQPHGTGHPIGERLIELIRERTKLGVEKYGEPLTTHNGRDAMLDALQESIDLNQYLMQALMETEDQIGEVTQILHDAIPLNKDLMKRIDDQESEIKRLSEEQIGTLATFLLEYGTVPKPEEGACATAIRVISELTGDGALGL